MSIKKYIISLMLIPFMLFAEGGGDNNSGGGSNDPKIQISANNYTITEGNDGDHPQANFTISIDECPNTADLTIKYKTHDGSAEVSDNDYDETQGTVTFTKGSGCNKSQSFSVNINGDDKLENNEYFYVEISLDGDSGDQSFDITNNTVTFVIENDEKSADLIMDQYALDENYNDVNYANNDDIFYYYLDVKNDGPSNTAFNVTDTIPSDLEILDIQSNYNCSHNGNDISCSVDNTFPTDDYHTIAKVKVRVNTTNSHYIENTSTVSISPEGSIPDPNTDNNTASSWIAINPPSGVDGADTTKDVNVSMANIGDRVKFTITAVNRGFSRKLRLKDWFNRNGTDNQAFEFDEDSVHITDQKPLYDMMGMITFGDTVECSISQEEDVYLECNTTQEYDNNDSFTVTIEATVKQRGDNLCNEAHVYAFDEDNPNDEWEISNDNACLKAIGNNPPSFDTIPPQDTELGVDFAMHLDGYVRDDDIYDSFTYTANGLPPGLYLTSDGSIYGVPTEDNVTYPHIYNVSVSVKDSYNAEANTTFTIEVHIPELEATDNKYSLDLNASYSGNFITDDTGKGIDRGYHITLKSHTQPSSGSLSVDSNGNFTYTSNATTATTDFFTYTITDASGTEKTATVTLQIGGGNGGGYQLGDHDFEQINPIPTRNIVGNYVAIGNTVECVTDKTGDENENDSYNGTCQNDRTFYNNQYVVKRIDVDDDSNTWNSSSSNFTLPNTYNNSPDGKDILWAGLFWQGGVNNSYTYSENAQTYTNYKQRRAVKTANGYEYIDIDANYHPDLELTDTDANKILIKIDNNDSYTPVVANTFYYDTQHGNKGGYYSAFANVTNLLQNAKLQKGKHKITVANLTTNEGKDGFVGNYGGWSLVVIYKEDPFVGTPRNISIYSGYKVIRGNKRSGGDEKIVQDIPITGFKLPKSGSVNAKMSVFAGEGELEFGSRSGEYDKIYLKENSNSTPDNVPTSDPSNIFDSQLTNIDRDSGANNDVANTNAIDIDDYNVSNIVQGYRDNDPGINSLIVGFGSNEDYVTVGMLSFGVELYKPKMCYDYTLSLGNYVLPSINNKIQTPLGMLGEGRLTTRVSIQSQEADFELKDVRMIYDINDTSMLTYRSGSTMISPNGVNSYIDASSQTYNETPSGFILNIGNGATSNMGGTIGANERRYFKFDDDTKKATIDASFRLRARYKVNFGSGDVDFGKNFTVNDICNIKHGYSTEFGRFNIASKDASTDSSQFGEPYNLYTQVVNRPFKIKLFSYQEDLTSPKNFNGVVDFEPFNADYFPHDTELSCKNPDSNLANGKFVDFKNKSHITIRNIKYSNAARNVGFRIWYLRDSNGSIIKHHCNTYNGNADYDTLPLVSQADERCFRGVYHEYFNNDTKCSQECNNQGSGCYQCLKKYHGVPVCSRDNFSIRPESFVTVLKDDKEGNSTNPRTIAISKGSNNSANVVAGYSYNFDVNATSHTNDSAVSGYVQTFTSNSTNNVASLIWSPESGRDVSECNDTSDKNISLVFFGGRSYRFKGVPKDKLEQVGRYSFTLLDKDWTAVDWSDNNTTAQNTLHHNKPGFSTTPDCLSGSSVPNSGKVGCQTSSVHKGIYKELVLRYYPYSFNVDSINFYGGPNKNNPQSKIFINNLDSTQGYPLGYQGSTPKGMSYNIVGKFYAQSYDNQRLSNFTKGCYADPVDISIKTAYQYGEPNATEFLTYDLEEKDDNNTVTRNRSQSTTTDKTKVEIPHSRNDFAANMKGAINLDLALNYKRDLNKPLNPRVVNFSDFNVTYNTQPTNLYVNMSSNHKIYGDRDSLDQNISFIYGRVKPKDTLYDDILTTNTKTPVYVVAFCNLSLAQCNQRGVDTNNSLATDEYNWFKVANIAQNSNIPLTINTHAHLSHNPLAIDNSGEDNNLTISRDNGVVLPFEATIDYGNNVDRWLIYNKYSNTMPPYLFKVRFVNPGAAWSGEGKTGHSISTDAQEKKTNKVDW